MDSRLIELLVCPACKGPLQLLRDAEQRPTELACKVDRCAFPLRDGIPIMLMDQARDLTEEELAQLRAATTQRVDSVAPR